MSAFGTHLHKDSKDATRLALIKKLKRLIGTEGNPLSLDADLRKNLSYVA